MQLTLRDELPFMQVAVAYQGKTLEISDVLIDTGSASTILAAHIVAQIGIVPELDDRLYIIAGVGGTEAVFTRKVDWFRVGEKRATGFEIEVGSMQYGFAINGILGMDFLVGTGALIDLHELRLEFSAV